MLPVDSNPQSQQVSGRRSRCHWDRYPAKVSKMKWHLSDIKLMQNFMITSELWSLAAVYCFHFDSSVTITITADSWQVDVWRCEHIRFEAKRHRKALTATYFKKNKGPVKACSVCLMPDSTHTRRRRQARELCWYNLAEMGYLGNYVYS
jgi:hypothetical protein